MNKLLKRFDISTDIFDKILSEWSHRVIQVDSLRDYIHGYNDKWNIRYEKKNGKEEMIVRECILFQNLPGKHKYTEWKQVWVRRIENQSDKCIKTVTGTFATSYINKLLLNDGHTEEEIEECLNSHVLPNPTQEDKQIHIECPVELPEDKIYLFRNCKKYDINGAHCDALCEIFPKSKKSLKRLYDKRKQHPEYKDIINYYVGNLVNKGHTDTYNWIVSRTTNMLRKAMNYTGGKIVYANTDGVCVWDARNTIKTCKDLGSFKLEYSGDVYYYYHKFTKTESSYSIFQFGDEYKGKAREVIRDKFDLPNGIVVNYKINRKQIVNEYGEFNLEEINNVTTKKVDIEEYTYD